MPDSSSNSSAGRSALREVIIAAVCLSLGVLALPAAIFAVGTLLLGSNPGGLGKFYQSFFQDLLAGVPRTWCLVLGPYVVIMLLRAVFLRKQTQAADEDDSLPAVRRAPSPEQVRTSTRTIPQQRRPAPPASTSQGAPRQGSKRIEPRISLD